jgi:general secretion pathway protein C
VILNLCLLAAIAYEASSLFGKAVVLRHVEVPNVPLVDPPPPPPPEPKQPAIDYGEIEARDIFHVAAPTAVPAPAAPRRSVLQVRLLGIALRSNGASTCVIEDLGAQRQELYRIGDEVRDDARVERIEWQRVVLSRDGEEEVLELSPGYGIASSPRAKNAELALSRLPTGHLQAAGENQYVVDRAEFEQVLQVAVSQFTQQIHAEPYIENDRTIGYRVSAIRPGGLFAQIGLQDGDVVRRINDADFANPYNGGGFPDLRTVSELTVEVLRGGATRVLRYRFR